MKVQKIVSLVVLLVGIAAIVYALYAKGRIASAKGDVSTATGLMPKNAMGEMVGGVMNSKASQYDTTVQYLFIGGIVLAIVGGLGLIYCGKCKKKR